MPLETVFSFATFIAMFGWILLVVFRHSRAQLLPASSFRYCCRGYLVYIFLHFADAPGGFGRSPMSRALFGENELLLAGWVHYLAFDLFIGGWESRDSQRLASRGW